MLTIANVLRRMETISAHAAKGDYDAAHNEEDRLHRDALATIATGRLNREEATTLADEAFKSTRIQFSRKTA